MTKPTTEELAKDCERIAFRFSDNIGDSNVDDLHLAAKRLRELERENMELRGLLKENLDFIRKPFDPTGKPFISEWAARVSYVLEKA